MGAAVNVPLIVDAGAGWGDAAHTVRELERAGASAIHFEDQVYPKRAHYHRGVKRIVPLDEILVKLEVALEGSFNCRFPHYRAHRLLANGWIRGGSATGASILNVRCDLVMVFPDTWERAKQIVRDIGGPPSM